MADWAKMVENRDAEIERLHAEQEESIKRSDRIAEALALEEQKNTRLRGEAQANYDEGKALSVVLDREIARLREELEENTGVLRALRRQRDEAEATIERVLAVLDSDQDGLCCSRLVGQVRAALEEAN